MSSNTNTNVVVVTGNLTKDAAVTQIGSGSVMNFSIACNEKSKKGDEWVDYANFFEVSLFGKRAEALAQYMKKGQRVAVEGRLHQDRWEKDGQKASRIVIRADNIELIGGRPQSDSGNAANTQAPWDQGGEFPEDIPY